MTMSMTLLPYNSTWSSLPKMVTISWHKNPKESKKGVKNFVESVDQKVSVTPVFFKTQTSLTKIMDFPF